MNTKYPAGITEESRDYRPEEFKEEDDPRFGVAFRECVFTQVICLSAILAEFITAFLLSPKEPEKMTYLFGFPTWFVVSGAIALAVFVIVTARVASFREDISFEARDGGMK